MKMVIITDYLLFFAMLFMQHRGSWFTYITLPDHSVVEHPIFQVVLRRYIQQVVFARMREDLLPGKPIASFFQSFTNAHFKILTKYPGGTD